MGACRPACRQWPFRSASPGSPGSRPARRPRRRRNPPRSASRLAIQAPRSSSTRCAAQRTSAAGRPVEAGLGDEAATRGGDLVRQLVEDPRLAAVDLKSSQSVPAAIAVRASAATWRGTTARFTKRSTPSSVRRADTASAASSPIPPTRSAPSSAASAVARRPSRPATTTRIRSLDQQPDEPAALSP